MLALFAALAAPAIGYAAAGTKAPSRVGALPATYTGLIPCADCAGIRYQIDLLPGSAFAQRMSYLRNGRDETYYELGTWSVSADGRTLVLDGSREVSYWALKDAKTLAKLDGQGDPIVSTLPHELRRATGVPSVEPRLRLQGMFRTRADAPRFRDCRSGLEWPVARSDDFPALERAYVERRSGPGAELRVALDARIERRSRADGTDTHATLVVEDFVRATPGDTCEPRAVAPGLVHTRWRPVRIGEQRVTVTGQEREPWFVLDPKAKQVTGSGGCNRFTGTFEAGAGTLTFGPLAGTRMACPSLDRETAFLRALEGTKRFRLAGRRLDLEDAAGVVLMELEERNLK